MFENNTISWEEVFVFPTSFSCLWTDHVTGPQQTFDTVIVADNDGLGGPANDSKL